MAQFNKYSFQQIKQDTYQTTTRATATPARNAQHQEAMRRLHDQPQ